MDGHVSRDLAAVRAMAEPLRWREIESHGDGQWVVTRGRVGTVTLRCVRDHDVWAEFELAVEPRGLRIPCFAFPTTYRRLRTPLEPGRKRTVLARVSLSGPGGPELHVAAWS